MGCKRWPLTGSRLPLAVVRQKQFSTVISILRYRETSLVDGIVHCWSDGNRYVVV